MSSTHTRRLAACLIALALAAALPAASVAQTHVGANQTHV